MFLWIRSGWRILGRVMLLTSLTAFLCSNQFTAMRLALNFWDPFSISQYRLSRLTDKEYEDAINQAADDGEIVEAQALVAIAEENGRELPEELILRTQENMIDSGLRNASDFLHGAVTGEVTSAASIGGVIVADYVGVGDTRDVVVQGTKLIKGDDCDRLTLGLALAGLATVVPGSGLADAGFSILKTANKSGKISAGLASHLRSTAVKIVDADGLRRGLSTISPPKIRMPPASEIRAVFSKIDWRRVAKGDFDELRQPISKLIPMDVKAAKAAFSGAVRQEAVDEIRVIVHSTTGIVAAGGIKTAFRAVEHADDVKDLSRFHSLAARMGGKTSAVVKVLGKNAIKLGKLLYLVVAVIIAALGWLLTALWSSYSILRATYRIAARGRRIA